MKPSNNGKEGQSHPHILATPLFDVASQKKNPTPYVYPGVPGEPTTAMLYDGYGLEYTAEPSDGWNPNLPNATQYTDDAGSSYNDGYYFTFCGLAQQMLPRGTCRFLITMPPILSQIPFLVTGKMVVHIVRAL